MRNDVTCFSNRCCNVVGRLIETALWPLDFFLEVLVGRVSPKKTQGSPPSSTERHYWNQPGDHTGGLQGIIRLCYRPSGPKPEIQHDWRGRGMPTLTWEEVTIREGKKMLWLYQNGNYELRILFDSDLLPMHEESCQLCRFLHDPIHLSTYPWRWLV